MNFRLTMVLVILVAIGACIYLMIPAPSDVKVEPNKTTPVFASAPKDIKSITYIRDNTEEWNLVRDGTQWKINYHVSAPADTLVSAAADTNAVEPLVRTLTSLSYKQKFDPMPSGPHSVEEVGVASNADIVKFTDDAGHDYTLNFGKRSVDGMYATLNGDKSIYLLDIPSLESFNKKVDSFRDMNIKKIDGDKITGLTVTTKEGAVSLEKTGGKWLITAPVSARAKDEAVQGILREMENIRASEFPALSKDLVGLKQPQVTVTAYVEESPAPVTTTASQPATSTKPARTPVTLELGVYTNMLDPSYVYAGLAGSDQVFTLLKSTLEAVNHPLKDLRDPAITPADILGATEMTISVDGKTTVAASKKDGAWMLTSAASPVAGDPAAIGAFLDTVKGLVAIKYVDNAGDLKSIGLDPPHMKIELTVPGQVAHEVILVGNPETADKVTPMMRLGEPTVYLVQTAEAEKAATSNLALRSKTIGQVIADRVRTVTITGPSATGGGVTLTRDGMKWVVTAGDKSQPADDSKMSSLLADFSPLNTVKYVAETPMTGAPSATLTFSTLEPTMLPATTPATSTAPAAASAPATTTAPATQTAASAPAGIAAGMMGPDPGKIVTHTLQLYRQETDKVVTWKAVWADQSPAWTFEPPVALIDHMTKETYIVPATQPATSTAPATIPALAP